MTEVFIGALLLVVGGFLTGLVLKNKVDVWRAAGLSKLHGQAYIPTADSWENHANVKVTISPHVDSVYIVPYNDAGFPLKGIIVTDVGANTIAQFLHRAVVMIEERNLAAAPALKEVNL